MLPVLRTVALQKSYRVGRTDIPVLHGIDLDVASGDFIAICGPSGCGKSTLLFLLGGLTYPTSGQVFIDGNDTLAIGDRRVTKLRQEKIGFVFQRFNLLPALTAVDNLRIAQNVSGDGKIGDRHFDEALDMVGLASKKRRKPLQLSVGEQQRVAIARAVVRRPAILLADEPTGNLDSKNSNQIMKLFQRLNEEMHQTIVMITHNEHVADLASRRIEMTDGQLV